MDMKRILQALDGVSTKPVEGANAMSKFLRIVSEAEINQAVQQSPEQIAYNQLRAQLDSADALRGGGANTFAAVSPEVTASTNAMRTKLAQMAAALKAKGIDAEAEYNAPDPAVPAATPVDLANKYVDEDVTQTAPTAPAPAGAKPANPLEDPNFPKYAELMSMYDTMSKEFTSDPNALGIIKSASPSFVQEVEKLKTVALKLAGSNAPAWDKARELSGKMSTTQLATQLKEGKNPHKVTLPVQMAMQHYQAPKKNFLEKAGVFETYLTVVEQEIIEESDKKKQLIKQYARRIAESVLAKEDEVTTRRIVPGQEPAPGINRLTGKPIEPQAEPTPAPAVTPLSSRYGPGYEGSPGAYMITVSGKDYKFAGRDKTGPGTGTIIKVPGGAVGIRGLAPVNVELGNDGMFYTAPVNEAIRYLESQLKEITNEYKRPIK